MEDMAASKIEHHKKEESSPTEILDPIGSSDFGFSGGFLSNLFGTMGVSMSKARQPWWKG